MNEMVYVKFVNNKSMISITYAIAVAIGITEV